MHYNSNKSKGYEPVSSGPNMTGYYMGESPNLMGMQTGGSFGQPKPFGKPRTPGAALLARALQGQKDRSLLEDYEREEAKRQGRGGLFGSIASTAGGLLGAAIGGPAGAAIGSGLGKGLGESLGAGKAKDYDASGTVFNQQRFRDVDEASEKFSEGILGRSLVSGAVAGATAGLTPGGGQYGQYNPFTSEGLQGIKALGMGKGVSGYAEGTGQLFSKSFFGSPNYINTPLKTPKVADASSYLDTIFGGVKRLNFEDGGYIGMENGGLTPLQVLRDQGLNPTDAQLALFQSFDPTNISRAGEATGQSLLQMTGNQGLASAGGGFGAQKSGALSAVDQAQTSFEQNIEDEQKAFQSQTLGTAADIVAGGGEFQQYGGSGTSFVPSGAPENPIQGTTYNYLGTEYEWNGTRWVEVEGQRDDRQG
tara:strand:- start:32 stop:1294 length:1263 start_codon:yes stop_codon:yes gene_type:complete